MRCKCGNSNLILLRTMNLKLCTDCRAELPWDLNPGQKPVGYSIEREDVDAKKCKPRDSGVLQKSKRRAKSRNVRAKAERNTKRSS
jgi:hypothetical protein